MIRPPALPHPDAPSAPPSAPVDVWTWIDRQLAQARTPEEHLRWIELIELIVAQEPIDEKDESRT